MANENMIKFLRGNVADLPQTATAGALYFTKDEGVYLGLENGSYHRYGDFITVADVNSLPTTGAHATCMYYCTSENILARYDSAKGWVQINKQPTAEEMKTLLGLGSAAYTDSTAYDAAGSAEAVRTYVGEIPQDEKDISGANFGSIVEYIKQRTDGIVPTGISVRLDTVAGDVATLKGDKNTEGSVAKAIDDAIVGLDLTNTYDAHGAAAQALADAQADATAKAAQTLTDAKAYVDAEDKFEIDMVTVNAHGGVAAGEDLNGLTTHEILKKILYPYVQPTVGNATATPNGGTYEKGVTKTITQVSISVTKKSEAITSVALYNGSTLIEEKTGDAVKNGGTITFSSLSIVVPTAGNQLTVKVTDAKGTVQEKKTTAMSFVYPYYMGTCAAGTTIDETLVESLTKKIEGKGNKSNSFTVSDGHMVFAYPKAHGVLKSILDPNNFETIGNYTRSEVSVTGLDGTAQTYYVYVSGATTVSGFAVNFKY